MGGQVQGYKALMEGGGGDSCKCNLIDPTLAISIVVALIFQ